MKMLILTCSFALLLTLVAVGNPFYDHDSAPLSHAKNCETLVIEYYDGGGMFPESDRIYIARDSAFHEHYLRGDITLTKWIPTLTELQDLCTIIQENQYEKIESKRDSGPVYDRGGVEFSITLNGERVSVNNSGQSFIKEKWYPQYNAIVQAITTYAAAKTESKKR